MVPPWAVNRPTPPRRSWKRGTGGGTGGACARRRAAPAPTASAAAVEVRKSRRVTLIRAASRGSVPGKDSIGVAVARRRSPVVASTPDGSPLGPRAADRGRGVRARGRGGGPDEHRRDRRRGPRRPGAVLPGAVVTATHQASGTMSSGSPTSRAASSCRRCGSELGPHRAAGRLRAADPARHRPRDRPHPEPRVHARRRRD